MENQLSKVMYLLEVENKYSSKMYQHLENLGYESSPCDASELNLSLLNKYDFGLLRQVNFDDLALRSIIETEKEKRNVKKSK
jgi:hypothetical protein